MKLIDEDFINEMFKEPIKNGADTLLIVCGYATPNMASWFFKNLPPVSMKLIVGKAAEGISITVHEGFKDLVQNPFSKKVKFSCQYVYKNNTVNSKVYIWLKDNKPIKAFVGSMDFTQADFGQSQRHLMTECDPEQALAYFNKIEADTIYCEHSEVEEDIRIYAVHEAFDTLNNPKSNLKMCNIPSVTLSLLNSRTGETHKSSGLNWGHRNNKRVNKNGIEKKTPRNRNEAYIPLPSSDAKSGFFPLGQQHFTAVTDDRKQLILRVEQQGDKAITTPRGNNLLGMYFRSRLNLAEGAYIKREDLEKYGRTDVTFYKLDDEQFFMDFSPGTKKLGDK